MLDKFMKAAKINSEEDFLAKYPSEEAFFKAFPKFKNGGNIPKAKGGMKVSSERWDPNLQMWVIDEGMPAKQIQPQKVEPFSMMENPYAGVFNQNQSDNTFFKPYNQVNYDGILTPNYMRKEFNPQTNKWDNVGQADMVELQPQYTGDWSNAQRSFFEAQQPSQIGAYKTTKGKRKSRYNTEYDDVYEKGGFIPSYDLGGLVLPTDNIDPTTIDPQLIGNQSYGVSQMDLQAIENPNQVNQIQPKYQNNLDTKGYQPKQANMKKVGTGLDMASNIMDNISSGLQNFTKGTIMAGNALAMNVLGNTQRDERLDREYQKPNYNQFAYGTGSQAIARNGVRLDDSDLQVENNDFKMLSPYTMELTGYTHNETRPDGSSGTDLKYGGKEIEAEEGETVSIDKATKSAIVWGNMKVMGSKIKFKDAAKQIGKEEQDASEMIAKGEKLLSIEPINAYRALKTNSGAVFVLTGNKKLQEADKTKQELALIQDMMLKGKEQNKMKDGGKVKPALYTTDKSKVQAYNDSLDIYNRGEKAYRNIKKTGKAKDLEVNLGSDKSVPYNEYVEDYNNGRNSFGIINNGTSKTMYPETVNHFRGAGAFGFLDYANQARYKQPEQPYIYQSENNNSTKQHFLNENAYTKKYPPIYLNNSKDPRIGSYTEKGNQYLYKQQVQSRPQEQVNYLTPNGMQQLPSQGTFSNPELLYGDQMVPYRETTTSYPGGPINWEEKGMRMENRVYKDGGLIPIAKDGVDLNALKTKIGATESSNDYFIKSPGSSAFGKYQFIEGTRKGYYNKYFKNDFKTFKEFDNTFKKSPELQEKVMDTHLEYLNNKFQDPKLIMIAHRMGEGAAEQIQKKGYYEDPQGRKIDMNTPIGKSSSATDQETLNQYVGKVTNKPYTDYGRKNASIKNNTNFKELNPLPTFEDPYSVRIPLKEVRLPFAGIGKQTQSPPMPVQITPEQIGLPKEYNIPEPIKKLPSLADSNKLSFIDIAPEVGTLLSNIQGADFVQGQQYDPTLYTPYQVSFQDRLNENNAQLKAMERLAVNNPSAMATLAAQNYQANNSVLGEQFRTNQQITNDVTNKNVALINDAEMKNISLRDQQYARQAQAEANTRQQIYDAMSSISNKFSKNRKENVDIRLKETIFPNYKPSEDGKYEMEFNGQMWKFDPYSNSMTPMTAKSKKVVEEEDGKKTTTAYEQANKKLTAKWGRWI